MDKIILCNSGKVANVPARFWDWAVGTEEEYTEEMKKEGWVESKCRKYLNIAQLEYLNKS